MILKGEFIGYFGYFIGKGTGTRGLYTGFSSVYEVVRQKIVALFLLKHKGRRRGYEFLSFSAPVL